MPVETMDVQTMLGIRSEPKRKNRWILEMDGVDVFTLLSAARPQVTFGEVEIPYLNLRRYYAGKATPGTMPVTLIDYIAPSASQKVTEWSRRIFDPATGTMGYPEFYQKDVTLKMLSPTGEVVEKWVLKDCWPQDINFNELDMAADEPANITFTLRYNFAFQEF